MIAAPLRSPASTTTTARDKPEIHWLRSGNVNERGPTSSGQDVTIAPPCSTILARKTRCEAGEVNASPCPSTATVRPAWSAP